MIAAAPAGGINQLVNQIFLPMISAKVRSSHAETVRDFIRARRVFFAVSTVAGVGFLALGRPAVALLLPPKYAMTGWMLQVLGMRVALEVFAAPVSSLFIAYGQTRYAAAANTTRFLFMVCGIWTAFALFGIRQATISLILAQAVSYVPLIVGLRKLVPEVAHTEIRWYAALLAILTVIICITLSSA
jgi:O-antigen/teichoic acid export membrane protein